ncbi:MAG: cobalamin-binding protein [OM182 bacterium]|uniref:Cobalamin-binding protein n=1 Tax=OM182 bacterium TaxID=2510334 RepID=A0A520S4W8_9GAMM|nr:MAG: cobalamin-binding protein [OM182 bacterium]
MVARILPICLLFCLINQVQAQITVVDDTGVKIELDVPPEKIVSLAPHLTELLFSIGVGNKIVGTVRFSDYPNAARSIPVLGDAFVINLESILFLDPDIVVAWHTGGANNIIGKLRELGIPVFVNHTSDLEGIGSSAKQLGLLVGEREQGLLLEKKFLSTLHSISESKADLKKNVFFQISDQQLYTVNDTHLIGQAISACGGSNIFGGSEVPVPIVSKESILVANPDIIIISNGNSGRESPWVEEWTKLDGYHAKIRFIDAALISRPSMRMLQGINELCRIISL